MHGKQTTTSPLNFLSDAYRRVVLVQNYKINLHRYVCQPRRLKKREKNKFPFLTLLRYIFHRHNNYGLFEFLCVDDIRYTPLIITTNIRTEHSVDKPRVNHLDRRFLTGAMDSVWIAEVR